MHCATVNPGRLMFIYFSLLFPSLIKATEEAKAEDTKTINNPAAKVKDYIYQKQLSANSRKDAANIWAGISSTITSVVAEVWKAIQDTFQEVIAWIKDAWEKVKPAFVDVGN